MAACRRSDEDQMVEIKERWSPRCGDHDILLSCNVASFEPSKLFKRNRWPGFKS